MITKSIPSGLVSFKMTFILLVVNYFYYLTLSDSTLLEIPISAPASNTGFKTQSIKHQNKPIWLFLYYNSIINKYYIEKVIFQNQTLIYRSKFQADYFNVAPSFAEVLSPVSDLGCILYVYQHLTYYNMYLFTNNVSLNDSSYYNAIYKDVVDQGTYFRGSDQLYISNQCIKMRITQISNSVQLKNPYFNGDFSLGVTNDGIFKFKQYTGGFWYFQRIFSGIFKLIKKLVFNSNKIIVLSYQMINSSIYQFSLNVLIRQNQTFISSIYNSSSYQSLSQPQIFTSQDLQTIVVSGQHYQNGSSLFIGIRINYSSKSFTLIKSNSYLRQNYLKFILSRNFIHTRTKYEPGSGQMVYMMYYIDGDQLIQFYTQTASVPNSVQLVPFNGYIIEKQPKLITLLYQNVIQGQSIRILSKDYYYNYYKNQMIYNFQLNRSVNSPITKQITQYFYKNNTFGFYSTIVTNEIIKIQHYSTYFYYNSTINQTVLIKDYQQIIKINNQTHNFSLLAISKNFPTCMLLYQSQNSQLQLYKINSTSITLQFKKTLPNTTYQTISNGSFKVDKQCELAFYQILDDQIIYNPLYFYLQQRLLYQGLSLKNCQFIKTLQFFICNNGLYRHYKNPLYLFRFDYILINNDTSYDSKQVFLNKFNQLSNNKLQQFIILTYKQSNQTNYFQYKIRYYHLINDTLNSFNTQQIHGISYQPPMVQSTQNLQLFIVYGKKNQTTNFYIIKRIVNKTYFQDINIPQKFNFADSQIKIQYLKQINESYLYIRNKQRDILANKIYYHYVYLIIQTQILQVLNQKFSLSQVYDSVNYLQTYIIAKNNNPTLLYIYRTPNSTVYLQTKSWNSYKKLVYQNRPSNLQLKFQLSPTQFSNLKRSVNQFGKYYYKDKSNQYWYVQYNEQISGKKLQIKRTKDYNVQEIKYAVSQNNNCTIISTVSGTYYTIAIGYFDKLTHNITMKKNGFNIALDYDKNKFRNNSQIKFSVSNDCNTAIINNFIYQRALNNTQGKFDSTSITQTNQSQIFTDEKNFDFLLIKDKIYKKINYQYILQFTKQGLYQNNKLYVNDDLNKLVIVSYQFNVPPITFSVMSMYLFVLQNNSTWKQINVNITNSYQNYSIPLFFHSQDFQSLLFYMNMYYDRNVKFININYSSSTYDVRSYEFPQFWTGGYSNFFFKFNNSYLYFLSSSIYSRKDSYIQIIYKIDKLNAKIQEISKQWIKKTPSINIKNVLLVQKNNSLYLYYDIQRFYIYENRTQNIIQIYFKQVGSKQMRDKINMISTTQSGFYLYNGNIYPCPSHCIYCIDFNNCLQCAPRYYMDDYQLKCKFINLFTSIVQCKVALNLTHCSQCIDGYFYPIYTIYNICSGCPQNCKTCNQSSSCTSCSEGQFLIKGACLHCPQKTCKQCVKITSFPYYNICTKCHTGYVLNPSQNKCYECLLGCTLCVYNQIYKCLQCGEGYEIKRDSLGNIYNCEKCPSNCISCSNGSCLQCIDNYDIVKGQCFVKKCNYPCVSCSLEIISQCFQCISGYRLNQNLECVPDIKCNQNSSCLICPSNYFFLKGKCIQISFIPNCKSFQTEDPDLCAQCYIGFNISSSKKQCIYCNQTDESCSIKTLKCQIGQFEYIRTCQKCDLSCKTCKLFKQNCYQCSQGYIKRGIKCIYQKHIKFTFILNANLNLFGPVNFINIISNIYNRSQNLSVHIESIKQGSIMVKGIISFNKILETNLSNISTQIYSNYTNKIYSELNSLAYLDIYPIISSKFQQVGFTLLPTNNQTINNETTNNQTINNETINNETINNETINNETVKNQTINNETTPTLFQEPLKPSQSNIKLIIIIIVVIILLFTIATILFIKLKIYQKFLKKYFVRVPFQMDSVSNIDFSVY